MYTFLRTLLLTGLSSFALWLSAQSTVTLTGQLTNCQRDTLYFFTLDGVSLRSQGAIPLTSLEGSKGFSVQLPDLPKGMYLVGGGSRTNTRTLILGDEPTVALEGSCPSLARAAVRSADNQAYASAMSQAQQLAAAFQRVLKRYQRAQRSGQELEAILAEMARIDSQKLALLKQSYAQDSLVGKAVALQTYLSYPVNGEGYPSEAQYFANHYFRFVDWSDPALDRLPAVHEAAKAYARTLAQVGLPAEQQVAYGDALLNQIPEGTSRRKAVLLGMVASFQQPSPDAFVHFAKRYLTAFPRDNPAIAQQLQQQIQSREALLIGAVAPEIALPNPEGDTLRLSDLRGQVVLVDFWASWCRPCRQENPNVVRMYEKFHDQGFEIMGVSLDRNRGRWVQAIEADGLDWLHVSDLKYWSSQAARTYGVSSIPYTVLLDREGRIVAKRLRGAALKRKVKELLTSE